MKNSVLQAILVVLLAVSLTRALTVMEHKAGGTAPFELDNIVVLTLQASCPSGWTDITTASQGFYLGVKPATGTVGDSLGTAIPTSTTDITYTPLGTNATAAFTPDVGTTSGGTPAGTVDCLASVNFVTTAGSTPACDDTPDPVFTGSALAAHDHIGVAGTVPAETFTGTANTTMRSVISPVKFFRLCQKDA